MKKENIIKLSIIAIVGILLIFIVPSTFSLLRGSTNTNGSLASAEWNVSLIEDTDNTSLVVLPGTINATYELNVKSLSEVDVKYTVVISNLPSGVTVKFDDGDFQSQDENNTISFTDIGTILYSDSVEDKTKTHTLTFSADANADFVDNQKVNIDVIVRQIV